jgi:hypothetical protein
MPADYQIRLKGLLASTLAAVFGDFTISYTFNGDTLLTGVIVDQAALHGVLTRCRDMGITIISMVPLTTEKDNQGEYHE